ncbi:MAG: hypothetical protein GY838_13215 [bacterium]|nr:hypothetical protein [bacterium]
MPDENNTPTVPGGTAGPNIEAPPIPPRVRPTLRWLVWAVAIISPTAGIFIPILTQGSPTVNQVLTGILGMLGLAGASIKGGLSLPWKTP